ncbi:MAG: sugar-binding protein [Bacillota bacterium]
MRLTPAKRWVLISVAAAVFFSFFSSIEGQEGEKPQRLPDSTVAVVQSSKSDVKSITYSEIKRLVREAVELSGGFEGLICDRQVVVIKPNLVVNRDYTLPGWGGVPLEKEANGVTTDWRVAKAVVELVREYNPHGKVYIMEGSAMPTRTVMESLNYTPANIPGVDEFVAIEEDSGALRDYGSPRLTKVRLPQGLLHKSYYLNRRYEEADVLISVPTLKNHWHAVMTGGIKNVGIGATPASIYGFSLQNPGRNGMVDHESPDGDIHKWIHDFFLCRPVDFVIIDGLQGIQNGPTPSADPAFCDPATGPMTRIGMGQMNMRLILAGRDAVAVDTIESLLAGWDPLSVGYLKYLNLSAAGNIDPACITVAGKTVDAARKKFAGRIPPSGGAKITDDTSPELKVKNYKAAGDKLDISIETGPDTVKAEIYIDGKLYKPAVSGNWRKISQDICDLSQGIHEVALNVYDRFLNRTERRFTIQTKNISDGSYRAPRAKEAPVIDGSGADACWQKAPWRAIKYLWLGVQPETQDFRGRYKIVWTPENLCFLVEINDNALTDTRKNPLFNYPEDDCVEVFLDEDRSGGDHMKDYNAFAYHISKYYDIVDWDTGGKARLFNNHGRIKMTQKGSVYTWEIALTVYGDNYQEDAGQNTPVILAAGKIMGFAVAYCDSDKGGKRESFIGSIHIAGEDKNVAWRDASVFGELKLVK